MSLLPIKLVGEEVLRSKARDVDVFDAALARLFDDMLDTMYAAPGIGLAGPQIGISKRVIVLDVGDGPIRMANPKIMEKDGEQLGLEGCLSIPGLYGDVLRHDKIVVKGQDVNGKTFRVSADGLLSRCFQHEIDHLDGKLFTDMAVNLHEQKPKDEDDEEDDDFDEDETDA
ncbi:MAG: peptide deformylase [Candidatus Eremiobacteraeota bacterium]|nr:peptide deformylase [Candidatus Eremiobacteraeota bacterium]